MTKLKVLDLGSGSCPYLTTDDEEVISVDIRPQVKPTLVHDLSKYPYPFAEDTFLTMSSVWKSFIG